MSQRVLGVLAQWPLAVLLAVAAVWTLAGAEPAKRGKKTKVNTPEGRGEALAHDTGELMYPSCVHCHSTLPLAKEKLQKKRKQAHTLFGAALRKGWRNKNTYADVGEASQYCARTFQDRPKGLTGTQHANLVAFLRTIVPADKKTLPKRKVGKPRVHKDLKKYEGGDTALGKTLFATNCAACHHDGDDSISFVLKPGRKRKAVIVRKVRGYDTKRRFRPSAMGYYTPERLSDDQLRAILAYLGR